MKNLKVSKSNYRAVTSRKRQTNPAGSAERAAKMKALADKIANLTEEERLEMVQAQVVTIEGHALSTHNACLVVSQRPGATVVGGFQQWLRAGRCVTKGESGLMIFVPKIGAKKDDETKAPHLYFRAGYVFDITQTHEVELGSVAPSVDEDDESAA